MRLLHAPRLAGVLLLATAPGLSLAGCTSVLGLDDRQDAVFALCQCSQQLPDLGDCHEVLSQRLSFAAPDTRADWLAFFEDNCRDSCADAYACYAQPGTCSQLSCASNEECCGFGALSDQAAVCDLGATNPSCRTCSNTSCMSNSDCCSFRLGTGSCDTASNTCI